MEFETELKEFETELKEFETELKEFETELVSTSFRRRFDVVTRINVSPFCRLFPVLFL